MGGHLKYEPFLTVKALNSTPTVAARRQLHAVQTSQPVCQGFHSLSVRVVCHLRAMGGTLMGMPTGD